jgi:hypothetical protein
MGTTLAARLSEGLQLNGGPILAAGIGAVLGGLGFGPLGAIVGAGLGPAIWSSVDRKLREAGFDLSPVINGIVAGIQAGDWSVVGAALWSGLTGVWDAMFAPQTADAQGGLAIRLVAWLSDQVGSIDWNAVGGTLAAGWARAMDVLFAAPTTGQNGEQQGGGLVTRLFTWIDGEVRRIQWSEIGLTLVAGWNRALNVLFAPSSSETGERGGLVTQLQEGLGTAVSQVDWKAVWAQSRGMGEGFGNWALQEMIRGVGEIDWTPLSEALGYGLVTTFLKVGSLPAKAAGFLGDVLVAMIKGESPDAAVEAARGTLIEFVGGFFRGAINAIMDHPQDVAETLLTAILLPESWGGALIKVLARVPFVGGILAWLAEQVLGLGRVLRGGGPSPLTVVWDDLLLPLFEGIPGAITRVLGGIGGSAWEAITGAFGAIFGRGGATAAGSAGQTYATVGETIAETVGQSLQRALPSGLRSAIGASGAGAVIEGELTVIGSTAGEGFWAGLSKNLPGLLVNVGKWGLAILNLVRRIFRSRSPSEEMADICQDFSEGFIVGIDRGEPSLLERVTKFAQGAIDAVTSYGGGPLKWLVQAGSDLLTGLQNGVQQLWDGTVGPWLQGAGSWIVTAFTAYAGGPIGWLVQAGSDVLGGFKSGVQATWDTTLAPWLQGAWDWITKAFRGEANAGQGGTSGSPGGPLTWLLQTGADILEGLKTGITGAVAGLWSFLQTNVIDLIPKKFWDLLHMGNDTGEMARVGERMIEEIITGITKKLPDLTSVVGRVTGMFRGGSQRTGSGSGWMSDEVGDVEDGYPGRYDQGESASQDQVDGWLREALGRTGTDQGWLPGMRLLAQLESSWNPLNINHHDIDNVYGGPNQHARGLLQVIPTTFEDQRSQDLPDDI